MTPGAADGAPLSDLFQIWTPPHSLFHPPSPSHEHTLCPIFNPLHHFQPYIFSSFTFSSSCSTSSSFCTNHIRTQNVHKVTGKCSVLYSSSSVSLTVFEEVNINVIYVLLCFLLLKSFSCIQVVINLKRTYWLVDYCLVPQVLALIHCV